MGMFKRGLILLSITMACFSAQAEGMDKASFYFRVDGGMSFLRPSSNKEFYPDNDDNRSGFLG